MKRLSATSLIVYFLFLAGCKSPATSTKVVQPSSQTQSSSQQSIQHTSEALSPPLTDYKSRITKKTFGLYITPKTSPVQPERFSGYHTGTDFETLPSEQNIDVSIHAICSGSLLLKKWASGYGGVMVQQCTIAGHSVTVIYGHLRLSSIIHKQGDQIKAGEQVAVLGTGYSTETDGERKHLHLAIHKGNSINILGYVSNKSDLISWLDPAKYLP